MKYGLASAGQRLRSRGVTYPTPPPLPPSPIQITANNHGYKTGQKITITGVGGITAANGTWTVTVVDPNNFTLNGSIGNGTYTSGGVAVNQDWGGCHRLDFAGQQQLRAGRHDVWAFAHGRAHCAACQLG